MSHCEKLADCVFPVWFSGETFCSKHTTGIPTVAGYLLDKHTGDLYLDNVLQEEIGSIEPVPCLSSCKLDGKDYYVYYDNVKCRLYVVIQGVKVWKINKFLLPLEGYTIFDESTGGIYVWKNCKWVFCEACSCSFPAPPGDGTFLWSQNGDQGQWVPHQAPGLSPCSVLQREYNRPAIQGPFNNGDQRLFFAASDSYVPIISGFTNLNNTITYTGVTPNNFKLDVNFRYGGSTLSTTYEIVVQLNGIDRYTRQFSSPATLGERPMILPIVLNAIIGLSTNDVLSFWIRQLTVDETTYILEPTTTDISIHSICQELTGGVQ